ncbi:MAG: hypothetical protein HQL15_02875 [Candidatus Omnitrophica bacterium]|nr:hypothetical protein [Candidatus Omnitrophota bacterium]
MENEDCIRSVLSDVESKLKQGQEKLKTVVADVDKQVRDNPWPVIAGVAVGCVLLGFIMGVNKRN